ncbi:MAG TPA: DUF192 domain-containing protein [Stellaceae bacterium]|nr:DUF192 domain-containing protein [Stellaceae bacterium]
MLARRAFLLLAMATLALLALGPARGRGERPETEPLTIVTAQGPQHFTVEVARTPEQMERGLMFRTSLAQDAGMLFDFKTPTLATMWMKNTYIPLDMLFVDAHGRIADIHQRAVPQSLDLISSSTPVRVVIELAGGTVERLGIKIGDEVRFPLFGNAS